jgi:hypothetical protein
MFPKQRQCPCCRSSANLIAITLKKLSVNLDIISAGYC